MESDTPKPERLDWPKVCCTKCKAREVEAWGPDHLGKYSMICAKCDDGVDSG